MRQWDDIQFLLRISRARGIARRYFVTNGFDGALTMLGLNMGFYVDGDVSVHTMLNACVATAIALMVSGLSSAYVSEAAERRREFQALEEAMVADLERSVHERAADRVPLLIAATNGLAPLLIAFLIITPLWLEVRGVSLPLPALECAIGLAFVMIFLLGIFIGRVSGTFWLWSAVRTLLIAGLTAALILLVHL